MKNKVLIIEDDEDIVNMLKDYLTKESFEASTALNGKEGIEVFKKEEPDIVLLDVMMPVMNGYETLQEIRKFSEVPVIMLTAKGQQMDKVLGFNKGCDDYIVKPFDLVELVLRIRAILRRGNLSKKERVITYKDLEINEDEFSLLKNGRNVKLTKKEFDIIFIILLLNINPLPMPRAMIISLFFFSRLSAIFVILIFTMTIDITVIIDNILKTFRNLFIEPSVILFPASFRLQIRQLSISSKNLISLDFT